MNRRERRSVKSKEIYEGLSGVNNTIAVFYTIKDDIGVIFNVDRDTLKVKKEDFELTCLDLFDDFYKEIVDLCIIASNYKPVRFSSVIITRGDDYGDGTQDVDLKICSFNDDKLKGELGLKIEELIDDLTNVIYLKNNDS